MITSIDSFKQRFHSMLRVRAVFECFLTACIKKQKRELFFIMLNWENKELSSEVIKPHIIFCVNGKATEKKTQQRKVM